MKKIDVIYNENGYIESVSDDSIHFEQENDSLVVNAHITTDKKVRAYIRAANNNSTVTDELTPEEGVYSCVVGSDYMAKGTLYIGFEMYDDAGYTERLEPLKIYIDSFVNLGGGTSDNVYIVTVKVGSVKTLANGEPATVENSGTKKDMILNFGLPRGEQGIQGIPGKDGYTPVKGKDYFTAEDIASLGIGNKVDKEEFNENKQLINWYIDDFYSLIGNKVDKVSGMGLSSNDFTNALKTRLENNTFDYYHSIEYPSNLKEEFNALLDECTDEGVHLIFIRDSDDTIPKWYILAVGEYYDFGEDDVTPYLYKSLFNLTDGTIVTQDSRDGSEWEKISVSQTDLASAIGDIETSLENIIQKYGLGGDSQ